MHIRRVQHSNARSQQSITRFSQIIAGNGALKIERRHLPASMYPGIGSPRRMDVYGLPLQPGQHFLKFRLNRRQPRLHLPATIAAAVVGDGDANSPHCAHAVEREPGLTTGNPCWHIGHATG